MSLCERREILGDMKMLYYSVMSYMAYHVMIIECMDGRIYCYSEGGCESQYNVRIHGEILLVDLACVREIIM